jgi:hypothetical protein
MSYNYTKHFSQFLRTCDETTPAKIPCESTRSKHAPLVTPETVDTERLSFDINDLASEYST